MGGILGVWGFSSKERDLDADTEGRDPFMERDHFLVPYSIGFSISFIDLICDPLEISPTSN